jgi:phenylacetate-CoA ligase
MEENKKPQVALSNEERFPLLQDLSLLNDLIQDETAPIFNFKSGDRLLERHLKVLEDYKQKYQDQEPIVEDCIPKWVEAYVREARQQVPFYRNRPDGFANQICFGKEDLRLEPWRFVHNQADVSDLLVYSTSGTTGPAMDVNFAPCTQASWLVQVESILARHHLQFSYGSDSVAVALICNQENTLTYASLSTYLQGAGILKINLNAKDWKKPEDRIAYLKKQNPEILTGDPFAFMALKDLQPDLKPKMMLSSAMRLLPKVQKELESYFNCPVVDVYSMTECRMIACREGDAYRSIRPDLYLETADPQTGEILPFGTYGELVITGGNNPFLYLIRYRTRDFGRISIRDGVQYIHDLEAREPLVFYRGKSQVFTIDISRAMMDFDLIAFHLHQHKDQSLLLKVWGDRLDISSIKKTILGLFKPEISLEIQVFSAAERNNSSKGTEYTSDIL